MTSLKFPGPLDFKHSSRTIRLPWQFLDHPTSRKGSGPLDFQNVSWTKRLPGKFLDHQTSNTVPGPPDIRDSFWITRLPGKFLDHQTCRANQLNYRKIGVAPARVARIGTGMAKFAGAAPVMTVQLTDNTGVCVCLSLLPWGRDQPFWWSQGFNSFEQSWNQSGRLERTPTWRDFSTKYFRLGENQL